MLTRSSSAKYAKSIFFHEFNEIDIFVEDTSPGYEKIYKEIFKRVFSNEYVVHSIFPLGSRNEVIENCQKHSITERPAVFIIDADLYLMKGEDSDFPHGTRGLFVHPRYCIENYLIDYNAIINLLYEEDINRDTDEIEKALSYNEWLDSNKELLVNLFIEYAVAFMLTPEVKTVSYKVSNLTLSNMGDICKTKISNRINEIKNEVIAITGEEIYNETYSYIKGRLNTNECMMQKYVSAKDYILPLLFLRMRSKLKLKSNNLNWKVRLSMKCDVSPLSEIKNYIAKKDLTSE